MNFNKKMFLMALGICFFGCVRAMDDAVIDNAEIERAQDAIVSWAMEKHELRYPVDLAVEFGAGSLIQWEYSTMDKRRCQDLLPAEPAYQAALDNLFANGKSLMIVTMYDRDGFFGCRVINEPISSQHVTTIAHKTVRGTALIVLRKDADDYEHVRVRLADND